MYNAVVCPLTPSRPQAHGFFRGLGFPLVSYGVVNSIFFGVYGNTLRQLSGVGGGGGGGGGRRPGYGHVFLAGCVAGSAQLVVACPVDVVKVVLQSQLGAGTSAYTQQQWQRVRQHIHSSSDSGYVGVHTAAVTAVRRRTYSSTDSGYVGVHTAAVTAGTSAS